MSLTRENGTFRWTKCLSRTDVITLVGGLGLAFAMFYTGIWAAGDAKLFGASVYTRLHERSPNLDP